jgi:hypothetical protein
MEIIMHNDPNTGCLPAKVQIEHWRRIIQGPTKSWVMFAHGTCVILMKPESELRQQAIDLLRNYGPVRGGSPAGDFRVQH